MKCAIALHARRQHKRCDVGVRRKFDVCFMPLYGNYIYELLLVFINNTLSTFTSANGVLCCSVILLPRV